MTVTFPEDTSIPVTVTRADGRGDEPAFELERAGCYVKVSYLYSAFTGWVRHERVRQGRDA